MALTVNGIRANNLNPFLGRAEADTLPWTDAECNTAINAAIEELWPMFGVLTSATVATDESDQIFTIPGSIKRVSRIALEYTDGTRTYEVDQVPNWRYQSSTEIYVSPPISTNSAVVLRVWGYLPHTISTVPDEWANMIAFRAAAEAYGMILGKLGNYENQMALDSGRVVTHQDAVALSAYWQRKYEDRAHVMPGQVGYAPRQARR